jgi:putative serine protease PepD
MMTLAVMLIVAVAVAGFFFGRSVVSSELATTPIAAAPTSEAPTTTVEAASPPATSVAVPAVPPVNDIALPVLPGEDAEEPVAAVARAVAPAVVLIQNELGQGSGIIYDAEGLILTNAHVVGQFTKVQVTLASGVRVPGEVLGADPLTDVAVVRIDTDFEFGVAVLAPESSVEVGQLAVAIGSPFGLQQTVTSGIVSAKGRVLENLIEDGRLSVVSMIQTDASINPGNSGGALADRQGRVIGMNTSIRTDGSGGNIGVGFAVPSDTAKLIADRIIAGQPLEQGFLGINGGTPAIGEPGVVVGEVTVGSGADIAGLLSGDLIVGFNGDRIKSMSDLAAAVRLQSPEATVTVEFVREGQNMLVEVTLGLLNGQ